MARCDPGFVSEEDIEQIGFANTEFIQYVARDYKGMIHIPYQLFASIAFLMSCSR
jgi:hypothetical protein